MDKKLFQKNKFTFFIIIFFFIMFILLLQVKKLFFPDAGVANYGDRLDGIVQIKEEEKVQLITALKENELVSNVVVDISGRILNVTITVTKDTPITEAKKIGEGTINHLTEETIRDYDIQVFTKKDEKEENNFPIIGYKSKTASGFTWTRDREKKVEEEKIDE